MLMFVCPRVSASCSCSQGEDNPLNCFDASQLFKH